MNICLISAWRLVEPLQRLGHTVLLLSPRAEDGAVLDLPRALDEAGFAPDLLVQQEDPENPVLLAGLADVACPRIFWSRLTHMGAWWTADYGRLFDGVLTAQPDWASRLRAGGVRNVGVLCWFGAGLDFQPHAEREHRVGLAARLDGSRPTRVWLSELLRGRYDAAVRSGLPPLQVQEFYCATRIAPSEAMLGETSAALFTTASAGCCVLAQDVGQAQELFFEPGREMAVYHDGLELCGLIDRFLAAPQEAERLGRAARARVLAEHLPAHRAAALLSFAASLPRAGATGDDARRLFWSAMARMTLGGRLDVPHAVSHGSLAPFAANPEVAALRLRLLAASGDADGVRAMLDEAVRDRTHEQSLDFCLALSMAALRLGDLEAARLFLLRYATATPVARTPAPPPQVQASPVRLLLSWARRLFAAGRVSTPGLDFDPDAGLPQSAADCLRWAAQAEPDDPEILGLLDLWMEERPGLEAQRLGWLFNLCSLDPSEWRHPLRLGLLNLRCFRLAEGLQGLTKARDMAEAQGRARIFRAALATSPSAGQVHGALRLD